MTRRLPMNFEPQTYEELIRMKRCVELTKYYEVTEEELWEIYHFLEQEPEAFIKGGRQNLSLVIGQNTAKTQKVIMANCTDSSIDGILLSRTEFKVFPHYTQMASNGITWEVATKDDLGIDLSLFNDKFTATVDYFHEKRTGIFLTREFLPDITGLESKPKANVGEVKSQGFDGNFALKQKLGEVDMTIRGNITYSKNEVLEKDEENQVYSYLYQKGYRVDQVKGLIAEGLFADYDDIRTSPKQEFGTVQPGDIKYKDVNGDGVVNDNDKVAIGATTTPNLVYGIGASFAWKGIDVNVHFQGAGKSTFPIYGKCVYAFSESDWGNIFKDMISDRWVDSETAAKLGLHANENPNATYPRLTYGENKNNQQTSTYWMRDGRYIRLKNLDIGYTLPKSIVNKLHFNNIRIYIAGSNLITWSKFKTWDPETGNPRGEAYPLTKSVTMGLSVNL